MSKFKVGDRVRTSGPFSADPTTGEVVSLTGSFVKVKIESGDVWSYRHSELEFVPVAEAIGTTESQPNTLTIEPGKYYRTRDGRKVGPIVADSDYFVADLMHYTEAGECGYCGRHNPDEDWRDQYDLIAEWVDEPVAAQQEAEQQIAKALTSADGNTVLDVTNGVLTLKVAKFDITDTPTVTKGQLVKTPRGYGYELARFGQWSWVDTGNSQPVIITTGKLSAVAA